MNYISFNGRNIIQTESDAVVGYLYAHFDLEYDWSGSTWEEWKQAGAPNEGYSYNLFVENYVTGDSDRQSHFEAAHRIMCIIRGAWNNFPNQVSYLVPSDWVQQVIFDEICHENGLSSHHIHYVEERAKKEKLTFSVGIGDIS